MNQFQPKNGTKQHLKELAQHQSVFYQIVLYRCLMVVQWCCDCLLADRVNCKHELRAAVNHISQWTGRFNRRVSRAVPETQMEKYEDDAEFLYDVILMANTVHPKDRYGFIRVMSAQIRRLNQDWQRAEQNQINSTNKN
jgi:hypothetical protein